MRARGQFDAEAAGAIAKFLDTTFGEKVNAIYKMNDHHKTNATRPESAARTAAASRLPGAERPADRRRAQARARIIDAAEALIARDGVDALTIGRIADAIDLTPAALYRYFPGKDAILAEVMAEVLRALVERERTVRAGLGLAKAQPRALASLLLAGHCHAELARQRPERFGLLSLGIADPRQLVSDAQVTPVRQATVALYARLSEALCDARCCGALADGDDGERAWIWAFSLHGLLASEKLARRVQGEAEAGPPMELPYEALLLALLAGWGAPDAALTQARRLSAETWAAQRAWTAPQPHGSPPPSPSSPSSTSSTASPPVPPGGPRSPRT